jgi:hypothetical protein
MRAQFIHKKAEDIHQSGDQKEAEAIIFQQRADKKLG